MTILRTRLVSGVAIWLVWQLAAVVSVPVSLVRNEICPVSSGAACPTEMSRTCPMHHSSEQARTCRLTSACASQLDAVIALIGPIGVLPESIAAPVSPAQAVAPPITSRAPLFRSTIPDSPPPRA